MKIGEVLEDDDEDDCSSQSVVVPCCFFSRTCSKRRLPFSKLREKRPTSSSKDEVVPSDSRDGDDRVERKSQALLPFNSKAEIVEDSSSSSSGQQINNISFALGLGVGLAFITAVSKNEFNKMIELRLEMETLIKELKDKFIKKAAIYKPLRPSDNLVSSGTSYTEAGNTNENLTNVSCVPSHPLEEAITGMESVSCLDSDTRRKEDYIPGAGNLEAEVEAEIERLQIRLDAEEFSEHLNPQWPEALTMKNTAHEENIKQCLEEVENIDAWEQENGICPHELEKRLHELLEERQQERIDGLGSTLECSSSEDDYSPQEAESGDSSSGFSLNILERQQPDARQQERIQELEADLKRVKEKLHQKEKEVSWWEDIGKLISRGPDAIHLSRPYDSSLQDQLSLGGILSGEASIAKPRIWNLVLPSQRPSLLKVQ